MRHEWLITSAECVDAKRRRREQQPPPRQPKAPSPGFGGEHELPENEQTREPAPNERKRDDEQPVGYPQ